MPAGREGEGVPVPYEPSAGELERLIERNYREIAGAVQDLRAQVVATAATLMTQLDRYVLTKVYEADGRARDVHAQAQDDQIRELKDEIVAARRGNRAATLATIGSFIGAVAFVAVQALLKGGS